MEGQMLQEISAANNSYNMTNGSQTMLDQQFEKAFDVISFGIGNAITVVNCVSLFCLIRYKGHVSGSGFWEQLLFLCITDIMSGIGISVFYVGSLLASMHTYVYYSFCCSGIVMFPISVTSSMGNCCMISVQRYIGVRKITQQIITMNKRRTLCMVLLNILLCVVTFVSSVCLVVIQYGFHFKEFCDNINRSDHNDYKSLFLPAPLFICIIFLFCINIITFLSLFELAKAKRRQLYTSGVSEPYLSLYLRQEQDFQYATMTFVFIVLALNLTFLPPLIFLPLTYVYDIQLSAEITEFVSIFGTLNSLLNPFVYFSRMTKLRKAILDDIWSLF